MDHLISNDRVDEIVIGTEDDVSIFHQSPTSKVGARLQGVTLAWWGVIMLAWQGVIMLAWDWD